MPWISGKRPKSWAGVRRFRSNRDCARRSNGIAPTPNGCGAAGAASIGRITRTCTASAKPPRRESDAVGAGDRAPGCGPDGGVQFRPRKRKRIAPPAPPVKDDTALLSPLNRTGARRLFRTICWVRRRCLAGRLGITKRTEGSTSYSSLRRRRPQDAAILLLDLKVRLRNLHYIASMGGYFGTDAGKPVYVFAKVEVSGGRGRVAGGLGGSCRAATCRSLY